MHGTLKYDRPSRYEFRQQVHKYSHKNTTHLNRLASLSDGLEVLLEIGLRGAARSVFGVPAVDAAQLRMNALAVVRAELLERVDAVLVVYECE